MAVGIQLGAKYTFIGGPREGRTMSSAAGFSATAPGYYATGLAIPNDVGQDGTRAVLNDPTDADFVGMASDVTGIDGSEVRESFIDNVEDDGGAHGDFFAGRRPVTVTAEIGANVSVTVRNQRQQRWLNATSRALRGPIPSSAGFGVFPLNVSVRPGVMIWTPTGFSEMYLRYRTQQPTRISGTWLKSGGAALIADDPRIYGTTLKTAGPTVISGGAVSSAATTWDRSNANNTALTNNGRADFTVTNAGDTEVGGLITLHGPATFPFVIQNITTAEELAFNSLSLNSGQTMIIDLLAKTVRINGALNLYGMVIQRSRWFKFRPGVNTIRLLIASGNTASTTFRIDYNDGWM